MKVVKKHLKDYFIPHHGNKHTPHALSHGALLMYSVGLVMLKFGALSLAIAMPAASVFSSAITPNNIISLTNASRTGLSLTELHESSLLDASAQAKAEDMLSHQYFAHTSPQGVTPWSWIKGRGYSYAVAGENLAIYYTQAEDVNAGWMASPTHRANIVDSRFTDIGVGVASGEYNGYPAVFVVQHFGKPPTSAPANVLGEQTIVDEPALSVIPKQDGYQLALTDNTATAVAAQLGTSNVVLAKTGEHTWQGSIPVDASALSQSGEQLTLAISNEDGQTIQSAAIVAPNATAQDVFAFGNKPIEAKIFGIKLGGVNDTVTQVYLLTVIILASLLLLTLIAKMHWKRLPLAAHVMGVIGLAIILMAM